MSQLKWTLPPNTPIEEVMEAVLEHADQLEKDAGFSGERHDGGARAFREQVKYYRMALNGEVPELWLKLPAVKAFDEQYAEYLRLKSIFE